MITGATMHTPLEVSMLPWHHDESACAADDSNVDARTMMRIMGPPISADDLSEQGGEATTGKWLRWAQEFQPTKAAGPFAP